MEVSGHRSGVEPGIVARMVTSIETVNIRSTDLTVEQISAIFSDICDRSSLTLKVLDLPCDHKISKVEPGLMARAITKLETVNVNSIHLTVEQISAIFSDICDRSSLTLKVLDLSLNYNVGGMEPGLMARAVTRLETVNLWQTDLTVEQKSAIKKPYQEAPAE